ncbi:hypothetical protein Q3V23_34405 [Streptomyces sp. VNUA116]|uniref:hypothetical protein n=1 Tax=Streptomyces sp. VNUA116 TaxID=3062449 RepID=UPI002674DB77|nr:hypothetical protein [Streptomyces sp. VNUA116]WKU48752.1 hypothetical protein Q3V23_34405 [Streptomyces sp. VNUA116]
MADGTVSKGSQQQGFDTPPFGWPHTLRDQRARDGRYDAAVLNQLDGGCGTYTVSMSYNQKGLYWTDDGSDVHVQRKYQINVPCA